MCDDHYLPNEFNYISYYSDLGNSSVSVARQNYYGVGGIPDLRGSFNVDDEGTPPIDNTMIEKGVLRARRSDRDLRAFLPGHPGRLDEAEREALVATLAAIVTSGGQFRQRCAICHGHAEAFAVYDI